MDDKKPEDEYVVPYKSMDKGAILQEARILFSQSPLKTRDCYNLTTKILYLLMKGDELNTKEATDVFFAVTKLFQSNDLSLRRMVYLVLKELTAVAQDVIIAISILVKDMNSEQDIQKANAIRVLCRITDTTMLAQIERYVKTALVDKDAYVSSSALVSSMHLTHSSAEVVRRWVDEVQNALNGKTHMVQYHALGVLHKIRQHDRLAVLKTITTLAKGSTIRSPYAHCLLIRYVTQLLQEGTDKERDAALYSYLEQCLRNRSELVSYEAARAFCSLKTVDARDMNSVIAALQMLMNTTKAAMRFAAVKTLHSIADKYPALISNTCSTDLEALIVDSNKSVAALAIVTSMKTEGEVGVDKLLRQLPSLMPDLPDEHKIVIVDSVRELVAKYRHKHQAVINALSGLMRDGGYEFKKTLVETILFIMKEVPESKESALTQLCEFIEDCEFPGMTARIIHLLGTEGPRTLNPSRYIRHIYNRIILESPQVRASAVQALTKFGVLLPELKPRIVALLKRCLIDNDDEVRDRATLCLHLLQQEDAKAVKLILPEVDVPLVNLKRALVQYLEQHAQQKQVAPFDVSTVSREQIVEKKEKKESKAVPDNVAQKQLLSIQQANAAVSVDVGQQKNEELEAKIEAFQRQFKVGALSHTTKSSDLTEAETEFVVSCVKHFFANHVLFQFNVRNTLNDQVIDNVSVEMVPDEDADGFKVEAVLEATRVGCGETRAVWLLLHRPSSAVPVTASFHNTLKFTTKDWDSSSGEVDDSSAMPDQYQIEDVEIALADYIKGTNVEEFAARWEELGEEHECTETFSLSNAKSLQEGVKDILDFLGMTPQEKSDVVPAKRTKHAMFLAGEYLGGIPLLARVRMQIPPSGGVGVQLCIRSTDGELSAAIAGAMFA